MNNVIKLLSNRYKIVISNLHKSSAKKVFMCIIDIYIDIGFKDI